MVWISNGDTGLSVRTKLNTIPNDGSTALVPQLILPRQTPTGTGVLTFNPIPGTYTDLKIVGICRSTKAGTGVDNAALTFNNDTGSNYAYQIAYTSGNLTNIGSGLQATTQASILGMQAPTAGDVAGYFAQFELLVSSYAATTANKIVTGHIGTLNGNALTSLYDQSLTGVWANTAAITRIDLTLPSGNWAAGTSFSLWGYP